MSSCSSVDRAPACCLGGHGFDFCQGLRVFLCPTLASCCSVHFSHFSGNHYSPSNSQKLSSASSWACQASNACLSSSLQQNHFNIVTNQFWHKIWLSVWCHHLVNLHILKTWISLERKEIFENSKQHFSYHEVYLLVFLNGLDKIDAIFVIVPL